MTIDTTSIDWETLLEEFLPFRQMANSLPKIDSPECPDITAMQKVQLAKGEAYSKAGLDDRHCKRRGRRGGRRNDLSEDLHTEDGSSTLTFDHARQFRLAPEYKFPIPGKDCYTGFPWALAHATELGVDTSRTVATGFSAGGGCTFMVGLIDIDSGNPRRKFKAPVVPVTSILGEVPDRYKDQGYHIFMESYVRNREDDKHKYASLVIHSRLEELPPNYVVVAGMDPLRDDGLIYAKGLDRLGVPIELDPYPWPPHGFMMFPLPSSQRLITT
ncbi:hypothetical protein BZG36_02171 [Bifiguratus adelaidae]|uniref:Alpha/beta hydrolase fold-3 domain-containing protein n=1 Tax=Bifiguratus adelaidae TaxID=1938954 RepID=A0A261Y0Z6_9FUNG|nr:hypothetical protein BZG36_02171 [Bifiguratus adelaidae]